MKPVICTIIVVSNFFIIANDLIAQNLNGEYKRTMNFGYNEILIINESSNFLRRLESDDGITSEYSGKIQNEAGRMFLKDLGHGRGKPANLPKLESVTSVSWSHRIYLIPEGEEFSFCNQVNLGLEPRPNMAGQFFVKGLDFLPKSKFPDIPAAWEPHILRNQVSGELSIITNKTAKIASGSGRGLEKGMIVYVWSNDINEKNHNGNFDSSHQPVQHGPAVISDVGMSESRLRILESSTLRNLVDKTYHFSTKIPNGISLFRITIK